MKLPLIPVLLAALVCLLCRNTAASLPILLPPASGQTIYAGSLQNNWQNWSWAATTANNSSPALSSGSIKVQAQAWQAVYLEHSALRTTPLLCVSFWINGGPTGGQMLVVKALRNGVPQIAVPLGPLKANRWQQVQLALPRLGAAAVSDFDGFWIQNNTPNTLAPFYVDRIALTVIGALPLPPAPAAPGGLTATPEWTKSCPVCGGMAMAHIVLNWNVSAGAASYTVYRDGVKQASVATPGWTDMGVTSGQTYSYAVSATGIGGEGAQSASVSATAPSPPSAAVLTAPVNLSVQGVWSGAPTDTLTWSAVPGAASYNVYQYGTQIASGLSSTSLAIPVSAWGNGLTYTVTAVDSMGMESLPSALAGAQGAQDPSQAPVWYPDAPVVPTSLSATPEWNGGKPRIHLFWHGSGTDYTYTLYRDGQPVLSGLWGLNAYDLNVQPGETHSYSVTASNVVWTHAIESAASSPVTATALSAAPTPAFAAVQVINVTPNDDSALVSFAPVPGAADYRVYDAANPNSFKYSGGSLSIEMNGLDPSGATLIVEAVDKLGPFQTMDGMAGPGAMQMDGMHQAINGQGDPSDIPNVLASSAPIPVTMTPRVLSGDQAFFDTFRAEPPLTPQPLPASLPGTFYGDPENYAASANSKWTVRNYGGDLKDSKVFFMGSHFMDTLYDGGTPGGSDPMHNNNASLVMMPNATADISGGKVLHVTFEVDAHMDSRRWCDVFVGPAGDTLVDPGKFADFPNRRPTLDGKLFRWEIQSPAHMLSLFPGVQPDAQSDIIHLTDQANGVGPDSFGLCARSGPWCAVPFNGMSGDLDKRHKFDLYLSQSRAVIMEQGQVVKDVTFPAGVTLPFDQCQVYFVHQLYHTGNDRPELLDYDPTDSYWINNRPYADERHWDNLGFSVLDAFPALP
jgi:hypothetical protein